MSDNRASALRQLLRERFPAAHAPGLRAAAEPDAAGKAGSAPGMEIDFTPSRITEVVVEQPGCGGALLLGDLLARATREGRFLVLIDGRDSFDPDSHGATLCRHLLWVRCGDAGEALRATDLLLRDGNLPALVLDLQLNPPTEFRELPRSVWHRFRGLAEQSGAALLVLTAAPLVASAHHRFLLGSRFQSADLDEPREALSALRRPRLIRSRTEARPPHSVP